jgi:integrase
MTLRPNVALRLVPEPTGSWRRRLHDLRHTYATILLVTDKHPKFIRKRLDHTSMDITLDTYSHVIEGMGGGLADAYGRGAVMVYCCRIVAIGVFGLTSVARVPHR